MSNPFGAAPGINPGMPVQATMPLPQPQVAAQDKIRLTVGPFVLSYPSLFVPKKKMNEKLQPGQQPTLKYSAELICYMDSPEAQAIYQKLAEAANAMCMQKFGKTFDSPMFKNKPIRNLAEREKYEGKPGFFISAKSSQKPGVVVGNPPVLATDPDDLYAGCLVYADIAPGFYDSDGNKGINWYLNNVWKVGEGPRLSENHDPVSAFSHLIGVVPVSVAQPSYAPPAEAMPPWMQQQAVQQPQYAVPPQQYGQVPPGYMAAPPGIPPMPGAPPAGYGQPVMPGQWQMPQ